MRALTLALVLSAACDAAPTAPQADQVADSSCFAMAYDTATTREIVARVPCASTNPGDS